MGEKVYRPIIKDGDHLIRSKDNPDRVRGLTRDINNQNPDIIEWEEYDVDDLKGDDYTPIPSVETPVELTPEQKEFAQQVGEALGTALAVGGIYIFKNVISPWWKETAWPKLKSTFSSKKKNSKHTPSGIIAKDNETDDIRYNELSTQIDNVFESTYYNLTDEELSEHLTRLFYHMLGMVNEIRIISNAHIQKECKDKEKRIAKQKEAELFLAQKVSYHLDQLLMNSNLKLDLNTSREIFSLTGGGVRLNGEYVPTQAKKINDTLNTIPITK